MTELTASERLRVFGLTADRSRRRLISRVLNIPVLRWTLGGGGDQLLIVPQDLRTSDPSFWQELRHGQVGLAGSIATLHSQSPFDVRPPTPAWARALHGFSWLRHLDAMERDDARDLARELVVEWASRDLGARGPAAEPAVAGRRLISWISHATVLLDAADQKVFDTITDSLDLQLRRLAATWRDAPPGYPRLLTLTALTLADLCVAGHERHLTGVERILAEELELQILPDGGHISRNPHVPIELMLDLLPLRQCFGARDRAAPEALDEAIRRILPMIRYMRLGDGMPARFNGMGVASPAAQATVLAYDDRPSEKLAHADASGYARLVRGRTEIVVDVGVPPPIEFAAEAHAGCLSFEMSVGTALLFVNGGAPSPADANWRPASRATASHNTLSLAEQSSSRLVRHKGLVELLGASPIRLPHSVTSDIADGDDIRLAARHDGYLGRYGVTHERILRLSPDGAVLEGRDRIEGPGGRAVRLQHDLPFAIHFHLHPDVACRYEAEPGAVLIELPHRAEAWRFTAAGAVLAIEESIHFADSAGPRRALQIVLRGLTAGESEVSWSVSAIAEGSAAIVSGERAMSAEPEP